MGNLFDQHLKGQEVTQVCFVLDYIQIVFADESSLTVNNQYEFIGAEPSAFIGAIVERTTTTERHFRIRFSNKRELRVGISEGDYYCPEAMVYYTKTAEHIVW